MIPARTQPFLISLQSTLLLLVAVALLAGIVPAGLVLDRLLAQEVEARAARDLALAPRLLADRNKAVGDAMMMHAKDVAHTPALIGAFAQQDRELALRAADDAARALKHAAILVDERGATWHGPPVPGTLVEATRRGEMPVAMVADSTGVYLISVAAVVHTGRWLGAAGVAAPMDEAAAGALAALTRSDVVTVILEQSGHSVSSSELPDLHVIQQGIARQSVRDAVREVTADGRRYLFETATFAGATVIFLRDLRRDLSILPQLRRVLVASGSVALLVTLGLGSLLALVLLRHVRVLASAAERLSAGDFAAPVPASSVRELQRVSEAFATMRNSLGLRLDELRTANRLLEERQARLAALQSELIRRERVAASGRLATELAHEIRNPVANLRNCLELIYRRLADDPQGQEFASLAIDELLRMHELAERMLDLNRATESSLRHCDAVEVAREVAALSRVGADQAAGTITVRAEQGAPAAIAPDALKQVLLNLVQNAREARSAGLVLEIDIHHAGGTTTIRVCDNGPGIPPEIRTRVFDPFFTTRANAGGVGLGLFVVEGIIRGNGGTVSVADTGAGACFRIVLPAPDEAVRTAEQSRATLEPAT
jgi:signal transduction histidine kinase